MRRRGGEAGGALDAVEPRELADRLERRDAVHLRADGRGGRVGPERDRTILAVGGGGEKNRRRAEDPFYETTLNGTTAPVFSQTIASLPPWSVTSTNAIVNWSTENAGFAICIGTRTRSNFGS